MIENNEEKARELNQITIDRCEHKIRFLINGMKSKLIANKKAEIPPENFLELWELMNILQNNVSGEEYTKFLGKCIGMDLKGPVEQAEDIIKKKFL